MRSSSSLASRIRWPSWPSSQAMRNWRPLMVTFTCAMSLSVVLSRSCDFEHRADVLHRGIEPARDLAVGGFEPARARGLRHRGRRRAASGRRPSAWTCSASRASAAVGLEPPLHRGVERIQRRATGAGSPLRSRSDRSLLGPGLIRNSSFIPSDRTTPNLRKKLCAGKQLDGEPYVPARGRASTPHQALVPWVRSRCAQWFRHRAACVGFAGSTRAIPRRIRTGA